jgi:allantoin racemase
VISPNTSKDFLREQQEDLREFDYVTVRGITRGPESVECFYDDMLAAPSIVEMAQRAERDGFDAVVISCFFDPGLHPARELVSIPIASAGEAGLHVACSLGHKIGVVTTVPNSIPVIENLVRSLGLDSHIVSVRAASLGVLELDSGEKTVNALLTESLASIKEAGSDVIVLGCTGMTTVAPKLQDRIRQTGFDVPVVDPLRAALHWAETLVHMKLRHSRLAYRNPPPKVRT